MSRLAVAAGLSLMEGPQVRAVNLIPAEERRGAGGLAGRSGGVVYVLVGGLAVLVVLGVIYAFAVQSVADRKGQLASLTAAGRRRQRAERSSSLPT